jgi:hypothetical protein
MGGRRIGASARGLLAALGALAACATAGGSFQEIEFGGPEGTDYLNLTPQGGGIELEDGYGDRFGAYAIEVERLRVRDCGGIELGSVERGEGGGLIEMRASPPGDGRAHGSIGVTMASGSRRARRSFGYRVLHAVVGTILPSGPRSAIASFGSPEGHSACVGPPGSRPGTRDFMDTHLRTGFACALLDDCDPPPSPRSSRTSP